MENVRNHRNFEIAVGKSKVNKLIAKPQFTGLCIINEEAVLIERAKTEVLLNNPIYIGFCILELSKLLMAEFHNNVVLPQYGVQNLRLL